MSCFPSNFLAKCVGGLAKKKQIVPCTVEYSECNDKPICIISLGHFGKNKLMGSNDKKNNVKRAVLLLTTLVLSRWLMAWESQEICPRETHECQTCKF